MTRKELIAAAAAALRRGEPIPHDITRRLFLPPQRGQPRKTFEAKVADARAWIERVERRPGSLQAAYKALVDKRHNSATVARRYLAAKRLERTIARWRLALRKNEKARRKTQLVPTTFGFNSLE